MHPVFEELHQRYRKSLGSKDRDSCQLHPAQSLHKRGPAWSTQDVIEHLALTYRETGDLLNRYLERNTTTTRPTEFKHRVLQLLVIRCGGFPRGVSAPQTVCPDKLDLPAMTGEELCAYLKSELETLDAKLDECERRFPKGRLAPHFVFGPLTTAQWRRFHVVHGRHHLKQLARIRKQTAA